MLSKICLAAALLTTFAWVPVCGGGALEISSGFALIRHAAERPDSDSKPDVWTPDPQDDYINFLIHEPVPGLMHRPDLVATQWQKELDAELARAKGNLTPYAEALIVMPRDIRKETDVPPVYIITLQHIYSSRAFGERGCWEAMITLIGLGDGGAVEDSIPIYKATSTSEKKKSQLFWTYNQAPQRAFEGRGTAIWGLAQEVLLANPGPPATDELIHWYRFLERRHNRACLLALTRLFVAYAQMSERDYELEKGGDLEGNGYESLVAAFARTGGGSAIPLLRKNYENPRKEFANVCFKEGMRLGDPVAMKHLMRMVPPIAIATGTKKPGELSGEARDRYIEAIDRLLEIHASLEPDTLPDIDKVTAIETGVSGEFAKAWARFYDGVMANRVELIANPHGGNSTFQVVRRGAE